MGSPERAENISGMFSDPILGRIAYRALVGCGNCQKRTKCLNENVDLAEILRYIAYGKKEEVALSLPSKSLAKVLMYYLRQPNFDRYVVNYYQGDITEGEVLLYDVLQKLHSIRNEEEAAALIENVRSSQSLTVTRIASIAAKLWWKCDRDDLRQTSVDQMKEAGR